MHNENHISDHFLQTPGLNVITEYIIGYIYPGYPVANMCFKVYGYISMKQGIAFLEDFKLGHYMKIPPRSMFMAQVLTSLLLLFLKTKNNYLIYLLTILRMFFFSGSRYHHISICAFRDIVVAYGHNPGLMQQGIASS